MEEKAPFNIIKAAGGLLWRSSPHGKEIAVIHRKRYGDWTLPKGKLRPEEEWQEAAIREVKEETGCDTSLLSFAGVVSYEVNGVLKIVLFWNMEPIGKCDFKPSEEVDQVVWLSVQKALERLDYPGEKHLLRNINEEKVTLVIKNFSVYRFLRNLLFGESAELRRLKGEILGFEKELDYIKQRNDMSNSHWAKVTGEMLQKAIKAVDSNELDIGWSCLNKAKSFSILGLKADEIEARAKVTLEQANEKLSSWRKKAIEELLSHKNGIKTNISGDDLFQAHELLNGYYENQYFKIGAFRRQLIVLEFVAAITLGLFAILLFRGFSVESGDHQVVVDLNFAISIILFGVMGAVVSGMLTMRSGTGARIPEQKIGNLMIFARLGVGAMSALAISAFIMSGLLRIADIQITPSFILAFSFASGFTERLVYRAIETVAKNSSE